MKFIKLKIKSFKKINNFILSLIEQQNKFFSLLAFLFFVFVVFLFIIIIILLFQYKGDLIIQIIKNSSWEARGVIISIISSMASIAIIILIYRQLMKDKDISYGTFFLELNNLISNNKSYKEIFTKLNKQELNKTCDNKLDNAEFTIDDAVNIVAYFNFFSTVKILIKKKLLKIEDIDGIYAWRFFAFMNNKYVQRTELEKYDPHCERIYLLYYDWYKFRKKNGYKIPCNSKESSLMENDHYSIFLKKNNRKKL